MEISNPQVYKTIVQPPIGRSFSWKKMLPLFYLILIGVIIFEIIWGAKLLNLSKTPVQAKSASITSLSLPQLVALVNKSSFQIGEKIPVTIKVVTGGKSTDSTDAVIKYDPTFLEPDGKLIELGKIYQDFPVSTFDPTSGLIRISGITALDRPGFSGIGTLATLNFIAKKTGSTKIMFDYVKGSTADSNIVLTNTATDILSQVINTDILISDKNPTIPVKSSVTCSGYIQYCQIGEKTGQQFCQLGRTEQNKCIFDEQLTFGCGECQIE